jgi:integrase
MAVGRRSITGGVKPAGARRIQFDFTIDGKRYRPTLPWTPNEPNLQRARQLLARIKAQIAAGTFSFTEEFPGYRLRKRLGVQLRARNCSDVFDAFLAHEEARVRRNDLAPITLAAHRQILDQVWRPAIGALPFLSVRYSTLVKIADARRWTKKTYNNVISALRRAFAFGFEDHPEEHNPAKALRSARIGKKDRPAIDPFSVQDAEVVIAAIHRDWGEAQGNYDEFRFFTGLRPSEQIALVVSDFDPLTGTLSVTKARVAGIDRDRTKTGEDRSIHLCPRARAVLEGQLRLRDQLSRTGHLNHQQLFFDTDGSAIRRLREPYARWHRTLRGLSIRYRKPYAARHSSVSWNLMAGRNPLWVAKQHGHSILTMLTVYAAWTEGALEADVAAIRRAMRGLACASRISPSEMAAPASPELKAAEPTERSIPDKVRPRARPRNSKKSLPTALATRPDLAADLAVEGAWRTVSPRLPRHLTGGADGTRTRDPRRDRPVF